MSLKNFILLVVSIYLIACAQRTALSGGDKDILPPEVKEATPINQTINFIDKTITIEFNEFVRLDNLTSQLIVSPLMEEEPEVSVKGKKVVIKINGDLAPNTTYSLNFGDAIKDITEGNIYPNYKYVFSTGSFLDSLSYAGTVVGAYDLKPKGNVFVMLYDEFEDSIPLTKKPRYISKTNKEGQFQITNISAGQYKFFALNDVNSNYLFDIPDEEIGYLNEPIEIDSSLIDAKVYLFTEATEIQYVVKSSNTEYGKLEIEMNLPAEDVNVSMLSDKEKLDIEEAVENLRMKTFWQLKPSTEEQIDLVISNGDVIIDTVSIDLLGSEDFQDSTLTVATNVSAKFDLNQAIEFASVRPFQSIDTTKIILLEDSLKVEFIIERDSLSIRKQLLKYDFKEKTNYVLNVEPGAFKGIYNLENDTILKRFKTKKESNYGNLSLRINPPFADNYILYLLRKNSIMETRYGNGVKDINFHYLDEGDYEVKLVVDNNKNGSWDSGDYSEKQQPEKVIYYEGKISIQENWDAEIEWNIE